MSSMRKGTRRLTRPKRRRLRSVSSYTLETAISWPPAYASSHRERRVLRPPAGRGREALSESGARRGGLNGGRSTWRTGGRGLETGIGQRKTWRGEERRERWRERWCKVGRRSRRTNNSLRAWSCAGCSGKKERWKHFPVDALRVTRAVTINGRGVEDMATFAVLPSQFGRNCPVPNPRTIAQTLFQRSRLFTSG